MKEVAFKDNIISEEKLPLPIVLYPGFYGAFFGFKKNEGDKQVFFCSCCKEAVENYLKFRFLKEIPRNTNPSKMFVLSSSNFPLSFVESLMSKKLLSDKKIIKYLNFKDKICHECNKATPSFRYCHEMYGQAFKQNYGWYIKKQAYEWGIEPLTNNFLQEACPEDLLFLLNDFDFVRANKDRQNFTLSGNYLKLFEADKKIHKHKRKIWNLIENEVRRKFGHKNIGEAWTSETILYYIVQSLFKNKTILRHYRPDFLEGLELDIFIKELNIGIEYQGIQHYKPIKHWGGKESFNKLKERDLKKKNICEKLGIKLIYFDYNEELSNEFVSRRIIAK